MRESRSKAARSNAFPFAQASLRCGRTTAGGGPMRSWDPMKNFPELDGIERTEAERLRRRIQRKITRQPVVFVGLLVTAAIAAILAFGVLPTDSVLEAAFAGALVGLAAAVYMIVVISRR